MLNCIKIEFPETDFKLSVTKDKIPAIDNMDDFPRLFHEEIEIKFFLEGSSTLMIDNETIIAEAGDIVVVNPYQIHSTVNLETGTAKYHLMMLSLDFFEKNNFPDLRRLFLKDRISIKNIIKGEERLTGIIKSIVEEFTEKKEFYRDITTNLISELFILLLRDYKNCDSLKIPSDKNIRFYDVIYPALVKIRNDYTEQISVDELAELCSVSKYHFCRIFKVVTNMTAVQYQTQYRLGVADILLKNTEKSISEVAKLCGFSDVCYFSRCYKKHTGVSPKEKRAILSK